MPKRQKINGVIWYQPKQEVLENGFNKFTNQFLYRLGYPLGYFLSKKYIHEFNTFCSHYHREGKVIADQTIEFNSLEHAIYDMKILKNFPQIHLNPTKQQINEFMLDEISCLTILNENPTTKWVIGFHGWTENKYLTLRLTDAFLAQGYNVLTFDSYAHGLSGGQITDIGYTTANHYVDKIINYLDQTYQATEIGLIGNSMGASTILYWASTHQNKLVKWAVADCGFVSLLEQYRYVLQYRNNRPWWLITSRMIKDQIKIHNVNLLAEYNIANKIASCTLPILFAHGTYDNFVPVYMAKKMYEKQNNKLSKLYLPKGIDHCKIIQDDHENYLKIIDEFIKGVNYENKK